MDRLSINKRKLKILIAEPVPLLNKGEEAIVLGMKDSLSSFYDVEISVLDWVDEKITKNGIRAYPASWFYHLINSKKSKIMRKLDIVLHFICRMLNIPTRHNNLVKSIDPEFQKYFNDADLILVGHDGIFSIESEAILALAKKKSKCAGIWGCGLYPMRRHKWLYWTLYKDALKQSDFAFFREKTSFLFMKNLEHMPLFTKLSPDPAFGLLPEKTKLVEEICDNYINKETVAITVCEKSVVFDKSFLDQKEENKSNFHRNLIANTLDNIIEKKGVNYLFLPHSIEKGIGNDVNLSKDIVERMKSNYKCKVLDQDLTSRELKAIVQSVHFLIGERTHSLIGSTSVATPFAGLTNTSDRRTHEILGDMCHTESQLIDMDIIDADKLTNSVIEIYENREKLKTTLLETKEELSLNISIASEIIKDKIDELL